MRSSISGILTILLFSWLFPFSVFAVSNQVYTQDKAEIDQFFKGYMAKYNHYLSRGEFLEEPYLYDEKIMVMSSSVDPYVIQGAKFYEGTQSFLDNLKNEGVEKVKWIETNVKMIDKNLAVASNLAGRYTQNDDEYNRVGVTYMLRKRNDEWRITSFTVHNAEGVINFEP